MGYKSPNKEAADGGIRIHRCPTASGERIYVSVTQDCERHSFIVSEFNAARMVMGLALHLGIVVQDSTAIALSATNFE